MMKRELRTFIIGSVLLFTAYGDRQESEQKGGYRIQGDTVYIANPPLFEKIKVSVSEPKPYSKKMITSGVTRPIPPRYAYVAPPFAGGVTKSYVRIGQSARQGTPLFEVSSPSFTSVQKEYFQALSSKEFVKKDLKRKEDLIRNGVSPQRELEEAQNVLLIADKEFENTFAALRVYQVDNPVEMILGQLMTICSPIFGEVIRDNIITRQYLKDGAEPIVIVADLSKVWIAAQVKERDIRFINEGSSLGIETSALSGTVTRGNVYHVKEEVDEEARSIQVFSVCDNLNGHPKLGAYTVVHFLSVPVGQIQILEKASLQGEKGSYTFVQIAPLVLVQTSMTVETTENGIAVISEGLRLGDKIVSEGGYYSK